VPRLPLPALRRLVLGLALALSTVPALAQADYDPVPQPADPRDFVARNGAALTLVGKPFRFGGVDIPWLGLRSDTLSATDLRRPTEFEIADALATADILAARVVRSVTAGASAGCPLCIEPERGRFSEDALRQLDLVIKLAGERGMKVIIPLLGPGTSCNEPAPPGGNACTFLKWRGRTEARDFFASPDLRADFIAYALTIVRRTNALTRVPYAEDPTIMAFENCDGCGQNIDPHDVADWTEAVGRAIHDADHRHLYENGAFAHRLTGASAVPANLLSLPSVDILADSLNEPGAFDDAATGTRLAQGAAAVTHAGRAYVIDSYAWNGAAFPARPSFQKLLDEMLQIADLAGACVAGLQAHAETGGLMPPPGQGEAAARALYFPGIAAAGNSAEEMQARGRAIRVFDHRMLGLAMVPAYPPVEAPRISSIRNGTIQWRGAPGALYYSIQRSPDPTESGSWKTVCERCVSDTSPRWTDPEKPGNAWYRLVPFNMNGHAGIPSDPVKAS
jgi:mannan endo-1,4-beta-mannosidase